MDDERWLPHALHAKNEAALTLAEVSLANDFQSHGAPEIDVECLVGDPHCAATQLDRSAIIIHRHFIVLKPSSLRRTFRLPWAVG